LLEVYEDECNIFLVFEPNYGKSLKDKLNEFFIFDEKAISDILWNILNGL